MLDIANSGTPTYLLLYVISQPMRQYRHRAELTLIFDFDIVLIPAIADVRNGDVLVGTCARPILCCCGQALSLFILTFDINILNRQVAVAWSKTDVLNRS